MCIFWGDRQGDPGRHGGHAIGTSQYSGPVTDLLLRTSGEVRVSNFLLWQLAYTEMFFLPKFWPEISKEDFRDILRQFAERKRRFGS